MGKSIIDAKKQFEEQARVNRKNFLKPYFERYRLLKEESKLKDGIFKGQAAKKERSRQKKAEKSIAALIAELIKIEPSHLAEPWILWEVIEWASRPDSIDNLQAAFIDQAGRKRKTERKAKQIYKDFFLIQAIDRIKAEKSVNRIDACKILAQRIADDPKKYRIYPQWNLNNENHDLVKRLYDRYDKSRNKYLEHCEKRDKERQKMPYPYWGRDLQPL